MKQYNPFDLFKNKPKGKIGKTRCRLSVRFTEKQIKVFSLTMMCLLAVVFQAFAQDIVPSQIKSVTLFTNQALVTREADVKVYKGLNEILIDIEAFHIDSDSVSATVIGKGELYSVQCKDIHLMAAPQKNIRALEEKLRKLNASRVALEDRRALLQNKERFLLSVIDFSKTQLPKEIKTTFPKISDLEHTLSFLDMNFKKISGEKQALNEEIDSVKQEIQTTEKELASLTIYRKKEKKAIEVQFHTGEAQQIKIEVGYLVENASWRPVYKIDVAQDLNKVGLTMLSQIHQKTGEDWKNINLTVSNATPVKGGRLPEAAIWDLDIARPQPVVDDRNDNQQPAAPIAALKMSETETSSGEAEFVEPVKKEMPFSFEYKVNQKISIDSRDDFIQLPVFHKNLSGEFSYMAVPKTSPSVFLICRTTTDSEIMDGPVNVHFGSRFIGQAFMGEKKAGEEFDINIGVDRAVKIKRQKEKDTITETFFGSFERNTIVREMAFTIVTENLKNEPITVNILDSIPVSRTDKILVENINIQPKPSEKNYQDREGILLWSLALKPNEVKKIRLSFTITYPKDEPVLGL